MENDEALLEIMRGTVGIKLIEYGVEMVVSRVGGNIGDSAISSRGTLLLHVKTMCVLKCLMIVRPSGRV